jgi:hypothetical protein
MNRILNMLAIVCSLGVTGCDSDVDENGGGSAGGGASEAGAGGGGDDSDGSGEVICDSSSGGIGPNDTCNLTLGCSNGIEYTIECVVDKSCDCLEDGEKVGATDYIECTPEVEEIIDQIRDGCGWTMTWTG